MKRNTSSPQKSGLLTAFDSSKNLKVRNLEASEQLRFKIEGNQDTMHAPKSSLFNNKEMEPEENQNKLQFDHPDNMFFADRESDEQTRKVYTPENQIRNIIEANNKNSIFYKNEISNILCYYFK